MREQTDRASAGVGGEQGWVTGSGHRSKLPGVQQAPRPRGVEWRGSNGRVVLPTWGPVLGAPFSGSGSLPYTSRVFSRA